MQAVLAVVRHALAPWREARLDLGGVGDALLGGEAGALVVVGRRVLRRLGEREVGPRRHQRSGLQLVLERLEAGEVGPEGEDPEIGLVPERHEAERLVLAVGRERLDGVEHPLGATGLGVGAGLVDVVEEMQHTPAARCLHTIPSTLHGRSG